MFPVSTFPCSAIFSKLYLCSIWIILPTLSHFLSLFSPIFVGQFTPLIVHFCKMSYGLSLEDKEATQLHTLLSVYKLNNRCTVINRQQTLKEVIWLVTVLHIFMKWFVHWWSSSEVCTSCKYSQFLYHGNWNLNHVIVGE